MQQRISKAIEVSANVAIIVVALVVTVVLAKKYLLPSKPTNPPASASGITPGTKISLAGVDWGQNGQTLLLALQKDCHFCTESAPFYQRLIEKTAKQNSVKLIAVLPQDSAEAKGYLDSLNVHISDVRQSALATLGVRGTPTLILVDRNGAVRSSWIGKLTTEREAEVLNSLQQ